MMIVEQWPTVIDSLLWFEKMRVPPPSNLSSREKEHLDECSSCKEAWLAWLYQRFYALDEKERNIDECSLQWQEATEQERKHAVKECAPLIKRAIRERLAQKESAKRFTKYQAYMAHLRTSGILIGTVGDTSAKLSNLWKSTTDEEKRHFVTMADQHRIDVDKELERDPPFIALLADQHKKIEERTKIKRKVFNPFAKYLKEQQHRKPPEMQQHMFFQMITKEWSNLDPSLKRKYTEECDQERYEFHLSINDQSAIKRQRKRLKYTRKNMD